MARNLKSASSPSGVISAVKAAAFTGMAGRAFRPGDYPYRILIAIDAQFDDVEDISAAFAFLPQSLPDCANRRPPCRSCGSLQVLLRSYARPSAIRHRQHRSQPQSPVHWNQIFGSSSSPVFAFVGHVPRRLTDAQIPRQQNLYDNHATPGETIATSIPICQPAKRSGIRQMLTTDPFDDDKLREECGIFGVCDVDGASAMVRSWPPRVAASRSGSRRRHQL